jgi:hypothetical protein
MTPLPIPSKGKMKKLMNNSSDILILLNSFLTFTGFLNPITNIHVK